MVTRVEMDDCTENNTSSSTKDRWHILLFELCDQSMDKEISKGTIYLIEVNIICLPNCTRRLLKLLRRHDFGALNFSN